MSAFRAEVSAHLTGGGRYEADRRYRTGLFATIRASRHFEFEVVRDLAGWIVLIAGGDECAREFVLRFRVEDGPLRPIIGPSDIWPSGNGPAVITATLADGAGGRETFNLTRRSAAALYNQASGGGRRRDL